MTGLGLLNRWLGSRIGEGLIYDLRVALFGHVQRMPLAFFTHTQTGSLLSRLSNDVLGAQQAVGTLSTVTSDLFILATTLTAMLLLSWKVTLLALLVVPGFVVLDRQHGQAAGDAVPPADGLQRRHVVDDDRAVQRRRRAAGQAVRPAPLRGRGVRRAGGGGAGLGRPPGRAEPPLLRRPRRRSAPSARPPSTGSAAGASSTGRSRSAPSPPWPPTCPGCTRRSPTWPAPGSTCSPPSSASSGSSRCSTGAGGRRPARRHAAGRPGGRPPRGRRRVVPLPVAGHRVDRVAGGRRHPGAARRAVRAGPAGRLVLGRAGHDGGAGRARPARGRRPCRR